MLIEEMETYGNAGMVGRYDDDMDRKFRGHVNTLHTCMCVTCPHDTLMHKTHKYVHTHVHTQHTVKACAYSTHKYHIHTHKCTQRILSKGRNVRTETCFPLIDTFRITLSFLMRRKTKQNSEQQSLSILQVRVKEAGTE